MDFSKFLLLPQVIWHSMGAPRDPGRAWNTFWSRVQRTGPQGDVLWDTGDGRELTETLARLRERVDFGLPMVDLGCGNGRFTRLFAPHFPRVVGVDFSEHAIAHARRESEGLANVSFQVADAATPGTGQALARDLGEANVYMRGVLHVLDARRRATAVDNLRALLGRRGVLYLSETNVTQGPLEHLALTGATPTSMPEALRKCVSSGIPAPSHFGEAELRTCFPEARWQVLASGPTTMYTVPVAGAPFAPLPSYFALLRPREA